MLRRQRVAELQRQRLESWSERLANVQERLAQRVPPPAEPRPENELLAYSARGDFSGRGSGTRRAAERKRGSSGARRERDRYANEGDRTAPDETDREDAATEVVYKLFDQLVDAERPSMPPLSELNRGLVQRGQPTLTDSRARKLFRAWQKKGNSP
jgi:hypothetical protein